VTGCSTTENWSRTGYLGFLRRTEVALDESLGGAAQPEPGYDQMYTATGGAAPTTPASLSTGIGSTITSSSSLNNCSMTDAEQHVAVFVVGALDEVISLRGMMYHPIDIENSVLRCHKKIAECATFTWTNLLVVVAELDGNESEALDLVPLITSTVLEEHQLIVGVVVIVDPGECCCRSVCALTHVLSFF
jgi:acyl-CoA synthetase (AMP-forming)/AMP-acid ligase II